MPLSAGDKLGPYEILSLIGAGGMGEVYRTHDPRLGRDVAIKVSAQQFSDPRFGFALAYLLEFAHFHLPELEWWKLVLLASGTFLAFLWVVALSEEFFFRAFLQRLLVRSLRSDIGGLIVASVLFGLAHLPFRHQFPNWRFAIVAGVGGVFYGLSFLKAQSVRASMVTHALVVTTWRMFFA